MADAARDRDSFPTDSNGFALGGWRLRSACLAHPTQWWFGAPSERAKSICYGCRVRHECLDHALARPTLQGIWGATTFNDRDAIRTRLRAVSRGLVVLGEPDA
jgi:WhiB family redox-sensing transcriptional regulator